MFSLDKPLLHAIKNIEDIYVFKFTYTRTWCRMKRNWLAERILADNVIISYFTFAEVDDLAFALICDEAALNSEENGGLAAQLGLWGFALL